MANLIGQGPTGIGGPTSELFTTPYPHSPGARAKDQDGNEYLFVDFTSTVYYGCLVQINSINQAAPLLGTANRAYRVGVVCSGKPSTLTGDHPTSDHAGWVQIYGIHPAVQTHTASDGGVSATVGGAYACIPQTSVGTPSGTMSILIQGTAAQTSNTSTEANRIHNMWLVDFAEVTDLTTWPGSSGASGPTSVLPFGETSGVNTSAFSGQTYAAFLNYPYVTGHSEPWVDATSQ